MSVNSLGSVRSQARSSQQTYKKTMDWFTKTEEQFLRFTPWDKLGAEYGPQRMSYHKNFADVPKKDGSSYKTSVACNKMTGDKCEACVEADRQKKDNDGKDVDYRTTKKKQTSVYMIAYEVSEAKAGFKYKPTARPNRVEFNDVDIDELYKATESVNPQIKEYFVENEFNKKVKLLLKTHQVQTEKELTEKVGAEVLEKIRKELVKESEKVDCFHEEYGVVFKVVKSKMANKDGVMNRTVYKFTPMFLEQDSENLPLPEGFHDVIEECIPNDKLHPVFSNKDLALMLSGDFDQMESNRFKKRESNEKDPESDNSYSSVKYQEKTPRPSEDEPEEAPAAKSSEESSKPVNSALSSWKERQKMKQQSN
jgi:hypothetical protein